MIFKIKPVVLLFVCSALLSLTALSQNPIRIMPLGDSITYGSGGAGGYRYPLYIALTNAGYNVDYVGTQTGNSVAGLGTEVNHEGHGGWRITNPVNGLYDFIYQWFEAIEDPHVILLHIGTNDSGGFNSALNDVNNLDLLITRMAECQPSAQIIVTSLMKRGEPNYTAITNYFNPYVPGKVSGQQTLGRNVTFLDMHAYLELSDMPDNLHPDAGGYQKMADGWFSAITNVIDANVAANQPAPLRVSGSESSLATIRITFNKALAQASATNTSNYAVDGGTTVSAASLSVDKRSVTLTTSLLSTETTYTVTMNDIEDETTPTALQIPADSEVQFTTTAQPLALSAQGDNDQMHITILFNKEMASASATDTGNYVIDNGLSISAASLSTDKKTVTLTTSQHITGTLYTITMNNIEDESTPTPLTIPANTQVSFTARTPRGYANHVPESSAYSLIYEINLPTTANYRDNAVVYSVNNAASIDDGRFNRIAYYLELQKNGEDLQYLWVSMDSFTNKADKTGFPTVASGAIYQLFVTNMNVICNVGGVTTGTGLAGNLEFWPYNYGQSSSPLVPGASNSLFDFGDSISYGGYHGSMQIHNYVAQETLMGISNWGGGGTLGIGIGNQPTGQPDWTFSDNSGSYTIRSLQVLVKYDYDGDTAGPEVIAAQKSLDSKQVQVTFNEQLAPSSIIGSHFTLNNGVGVISAELQADGRTVILATTATSANTPTTLTINGIRDIATAANPIAPDTTLALTALIPQGIISNVGTNSGQLAHGYDLIYSLDIPVYSTFGSGNDHYYINQSYLPATCDRIAYYLELESHDGAIQYLWTAMDAFATDLTKIALPTFASGNIFQQVVTNLDVKSNVAGITDGTGMTGGNIEFWPNDYTGSNALNIPGASASAYDFGDSRSTGGSHGSMQVHNHAAGQCLLNISNWGGNGQKISIGIGNRPGQSNIDWTHAQNADTYVSRKLHILAQITPATPPSLPAEVAANVPSASGYQLAYTIELPASGADFYENSASYYSVNNYAQLPANFSRIAYYMELQSGTGPTQYIWTAMDAFTSNAARIGVPTNGTYFRMYVSNLEVFSNADGIINGSGITTGNIEFWPSNYGDDNSFNIPNASSDVFDFGDSGANSTSDGYGSMQVHNYGASQTLFAFNSFNNNGTPCIGIGNQPTDHPDWTHNKNAGSYNHRRMHVFVLPGGDGDNTAPTMSRATAAHSLNQVSVQFSEQMADSAGDPAMYAINNGVTITEAILNPNKRVVLLITTPLTAGQSYTLSTDGLRDRSANGNLMQPFATLGFTAPNTPVPALPECLTNVVESSQYRLIHKLAVVAPTYYANGCNYAVDESLFPNSFFDRIAYCMELESGGVYQWVYVSMDAFTADIYKIGVPTADRLTTWQRYVNNMNVYASANAAVTTGVGITTGNIEFWPSNYGGSNRANIPGAQSTFDFGDGDFNTSAGHGSMQIHNYAESQTIMAMNQFGSNNRNPALGIGNNPNLNASNPDPDWTFRSNVGSYSIKNIYVMVRDAAAVQTGTALTIANQPHSQSIRAGESATLSLYSPDAYTYQWRKNGIWISGATSSWLEFTDAAADNSGSYDVIVFATDGSYIISDSATLQVLPTGTTLIVR